MSYYGLLHEDLFFETSGEFFRVWEALKQSSRSIASASLTRIFSRIWKGQPSATKTGTSTARLVHIAAMRQTMHQAVLKLRQQKGCNRRAPLAVPYPPQITTLPEAQRHNEKAPCNRQRARGNRCVRSHPCCRMSLLSRRVSYFLSVADVRRGTYLGAEVG